MDRDDDGDHHNDHATSDYRDDHASHDNNHDHAARHHDHHATSAGRRGNYGHHTSWRQGCSTNNEPRCSESRRSCREGQTSGTCKERKVDWWKVWSAFNERHHQVRSVSTTEAVGAATVYGVSR